MPTPTPFTVRRLRWFMIKKNGQLAFFSKQPESRIMSYRETLTYYGCRNTPAPYARKPRGGLKIITAGRYGFTS